MNTALIAVDVQGDFLPGGALGVPDGDQVVSALVQASREVDLVVVTRDWHPHDHCSFEREPKYVDKSWPVHCVQDTPGAELHPEIVTIGEVFINKGENPNLEAYSGFHGRDPHNLTLTAILHRNSISHLVVGGLALDYCVKNTALDGHREGFNTTVLLGATRPVAYLTGVNAVAEMAAARVKFDGRDLI